MIPRAPWTNVGALQSEIASLRQMVNGKASSHEIHEVNRRMDSLERAVQEIRAVVNDARCGLDILEEDIRREREANGQFGVGV